MKARRSQGRVILKAIRLSECRFGVDYLTIVACPGVLIVDYQLEKIFNQEEMINSSLDLAGTCLQTIKPGPGSADGF